MSEEVNAGTGENPGKTNGTIGFVLSLVSFLLGAWIMTYLFAISGGSQAAAAVALLFPIAGIVLSVKGMKASKAAGHKNGLGLTGMIISIVALLFLLFWFMGLSALSNGVNELQEAADALDKLNH